LVSKNPFVAIKALENSGGLLEQVLLLQAKIIRIMRFEIFYSYVVDYNAM
jgi:hypothetical protein